MNDTVRITAQIRSTCSGSAEGRLGIDDPGVDVKSPNPGTETLRIFQGLKLGWEPDLVGSDKVFEPVEKLTAKNRAQYSERQQESFRRGPPLGVVRIEAAAGNDTMDVGMED